MKDREDMKALIEDYGKNVQATVESQLLVREENLRRAYKGFCSPYPFLVKKIKAPEHA